MNYKLEYFTKMRARKRERGECYFCNKPAVTKIMCEYHQKKNSERAKIYNSTHKEQMAKYFKQYYKNNREYMIEFSKQYYIKNQL